MNSLVFLRRMIISQKPSRIDYTVGNETKSMYYDRAGFDGNANEVTQALRDIFQSESVTVVNNNDFNPMSKSRIFAPQAISSALAGYKFNAEMRAVLLSFTMRLPPLLVRLFPMQRYHFQDNASYMKMHMQFQQKGVFRMQNYISQANNSLDEMVRLRVMIAAYTLGLIAPITNRNEKSHGMTQQIVDQKPRASAKSNKISLLSRIIRRIRGI